MGSSTMTLLVGGELTPIDPTIMQGCLREGRGYTMAYDEAMRARALEDALGFLACGRTLQEHQAVPVAEIARRRATGRSRRPPAGSGR